MYQVLADDNDGVALEKRTEFTVNHNKGVITFLIHCIRFLDQEEISKYSKLDVIYLPFSDKDDVDC